MKTQLQERLRTLKAEFHNGQQTLADFESRREQLRTTLLRISGAIQVLEELLSSSGQVPAAHNNSSLGHEDVDEPAPARAYG